jgi:hypothetical protein
VTQSDAHPVAEVIAAAPPARHEVPHGRLQRQRHVDRCARGIVGGQRVVEVGHDAVAGELAHCRLELVDGCAERPVVGVENGDRLFRFYGGNERGEAAQVAEEDGDLAAVRTEQLVAAGLRTAYDCVRDLW